MQTLGRGELLADKQHAIDNRRHEDQGELDPPSREVDRLFRRMAWEAVINNPLSDVTDRNGDGIGD